MFILSSEIDIYVKIIRLLLYFYGGIGITLFIGRRNKSTIIILDYIYWAIVIHAFLMLLMYISPGLREAIYSFAGTYDIVNANYPFIHGYRISGLTYGLSQTSVVQGWGVLLAVYLMDNRKMCVCKKIVMLLLIPLLFFSIFISGRSGIVITAVLLFSYYLFRAFAKSFLSVLYTLLLSLVIVVGFFSLFFYFLSFSFNNDSLYYTQQHLSEIVELLNDGESETTDRLEDMVIFPSDELELLFGSFVLDRKKVPTDIGYIRILYHSGIIGSFLFYLPFLFTIVLGMKNVNSSLRILLLLILLSTVALNFKEMAFYTRTQWNIQILLIGSILCYKEKQYVPFRRNILIEA